MSDVTAAIARDGSASQRASQWRRASAIGSMRNGGLTSPTAYSRRPAATVPDVPPPPRSIAPMAPDDPEELTSLDLAGERRPGLAYVDAALSDGNLANVHARGGSLRRATVHRCRMTGLLWTEGSLRDVTLTECRIDLASFAASTLEQVVFEDCILRQTDFQDAELRAVRFARCDLSGADFTGARLSRSELRGCTLDDLRGAERLRGAAMPWADIVAAAGTFADALGIRVLDDG
jgi:hypothetical protein